MDTYRLSNISLALFRTFLKEQGCSLTDITGGHEKWSKKGLLRPIVIQTHIDPIPEFILRNNLRVLKLTKKDFVNWLKSRKH